MPSRLPGYASDANLGTKPRFGSQASSNIPPSNIAIEVGAAQYQN
jgi:hypothetical protein